MGGGVKVGGEGLMKGHKMQSGWWGTGWVWGTEWVVKIYEKDRLPKALMKVSTSDFRKWMMSTWLNIFDQGYDAENISEIYAKTY